ncbi:hypothetical protein Pelo_18559 [Pelomyxa schiedti]|nr:hypothetical protein Pelo_18559 [Pelomyxa schiedti]
MNWNYLPVLEEKTLRYLIESGLVTPGRFELFCAYSKICDINLLEYLTDEVHVPLPEVKDKELLKATNKKDSVPVVELMVHKIGEAKLQHLLMDSFIYSTAAQGKQQQNFTVTLPEVLLMFEKQSSSHIDFPSCETQISEMRLSTWKMLLQRFPGITAETVRQHCMRWSQHHPATLSTLFAPWVSQPRR